MLVPFERSFAISWRVKPAWCNQRIHADALTWAFAHTNIPQTLSNLLPSLSTSSNLTPLNRTTSCFYLSSQNYNIFSQVKAKEAGHYWKLKRINTISQEIPHTVIHSIRTIQSSIFDIFFINQDYYSFIDSCSTHWPLMAEMLGPWLTTLYPIHIMTRRNYNQGFPDRSIDTNFYSFPV